MDVELKIVENYVKQCPVEVSQHEQEFIISIPVAFHVPRELWNVLRRYGNPKFFKLDWDDGDNLCEWYYIPHH